MKISTRTIAFSVSTAVLAACSGQAAVPESADSQTQAGGAERRALQQPSTYKITVENLTQPAWKIVARGFNEQCIEDVDPKTDQTITYGSTSTFTIRTGEIHSCRWSDVSPAFGWIPIAIASVNLLLEDGRGGTPQQSINLMEFVDSEATVDVFDAPWPFGGVMCVHPTDFENGRQHVIKPNENVVLTFRVC